MDLTITADAAGAALSAADTITEVVRARPDAVLALPTGSTPLPVYRELAGRGTSFAECTVFMLDEHLGADPDEPGSFRVYVREHIVDGLGVPAENLHSLDGRAADPDAECAAYEEAIARAGGLDLAVLGIGPNGHVAFNEPGSDPASRTRVVELATDTAGEKGLTIGIATITDARRILLVATGAAKAPAVAAMVQGPSTPDVPASLLQDHPRLDLILDQAAAADLRRR